MNVVCAQIKIDQRQVTPITRFATPEGYLRFQPSIQSFGHFLQRLPLKPWASKALYFDGEQKNTPQVYISVVNLPIGKRDLHQCADAVIRLRADYLYQLGQYERIHFNFLHDGKPRYFTKFARGNYDYATYWRYMESVFASANTRSLHDEMKKIDWRDVQIGDVLIQKKVPFGHAVIVIDMAIQPATGKKLYMLAQSYMPAQEIQILHNTIASPISPWYELNNQKIITPEWAFDASDWRRFKE